MSSAILRHLHSFGARPALLEDGLSRSYDSLAKRASELISEFSAQGVSAHDVVVLRGDFSSEAIAALLALHAMRATVVPVTELTELAWQALTESASPRFLVDVASDTARCESVTETGVQSSELLERLRDKGASGVILLSSGSTGKPKVILHDLDSLIDSQLAKKRRGKLSILLFLLFDHIGGINTVLSTLCAGGTGVILRERGPEAVCRLIETHRVQVMPASPTFLNLILMGGFLERHDLSSLRLITYGTEPMPEALLKRVKDAFPKARLLQTFGTSETGISGTVSETSGSTFFKIEDEAFEHRIVDGELQLRSRTQFLGYLNSASQALTDDGWFRTGDRVQLKENGFLRIEGRISELINVGGEKVLPLEVESVLLGSPWVNDCVVYGEPNAITGQHVCVEVQPKEGVTPAEVRSHVRAFLGERIDSFKVPSRIKIVAEIRRSERFKKLRSAP